MLVASRDTRNHRMEFPNETRENVNETGFPVLLFIIFQFQPNALPFSKVRKMRASSEVKKRKSKNHSELIETRSAIRDRANRKKDKYVCDSKKKTKKREKKEVDATSM